jgi:ABC-type multidrug transport system ATPase subunit
VFFSQYQDSLSARRLIGYCPQFDALFEFLTGREHLHFYARVRGLTDHQRDTAVDALLERLSLVEFADRPAGTYSGGNKRKLSVAIALIGNPPVVFLDEPSTGVDPVSRRFLWDFLSETMADRAAILTTHSLEECEALCSRIGILTLGQLRCIGTAQHLKDKYGRGFQLDIAVGTPSNSDEL